MSRDNRKEWGWESPSPRSPSPQDQTRQDASATRAGTRTKGKSKGRGLTWTKDWLEAYVQDGTKFKNLLKHCEDRVVEVEGLTRGQEKPNPLLTAVCCDLLDKISATLGPHRALVSSIKAVLFVSIYGEGADSAGADFCSRVPFFSALHESKAREDVLKMSCVELEKRVLDERRLREDLEASVSLRKNESDRLLSAEKARSEKMGVEVGQAQNLIKTLERERDKLEMRLDDLQEEMRAEKDAVQAMKGDFDRRMGIAHGIVGRHVPRHEVEEKKAVVGRLQDEVKALKEQLGAERQTLTPRPSYFRAAEYVNVKDGAGMQLPSRTIVDGLCDRIHCTVVRYERLENRLARPFLRLKHTQVDRFGLEHEGVRVFLECVFLSYAAPSGSPRWREKEFRPPSLNRCRLTKAKFEVFVAEFEIAAKIGLTKCREAFGDAGSGGNVIDLSFQEFKIATAMLACMYYGDKHHTHEDLRDLISDFCKKMTQGDTDQSLDKLELLEVERFKESERLAKLAAMHKKGAAVRSAPGT